MWLSKKILVATDFSEPSQAAADFGLELAQKFRVPIVLVHAFLVPGTLYPSVPMLPTMDYARMYEDAGAESLAKEAARLAGKGAEVITVLRSGIAWEEILLAAQKMDVDLVIVGTHGRRGLPRAILGSIAEKVVRLSPVPVLTIRAMHAAPHATATVTNPQRG